MKLRALSQLSNPIWIDGEDEHKDTLLVENLSNIEEIVSLDTNFITFLYSSYLILYHR